MTDAWEEHGGPPGPPDPGSPPPGGSWWPPGEGQQPAPEHPEYIEPGAPWPPPSGAYRWGPPPGTPPPGPGRRSPDPRTVVWVAVGVVVALILIRSHRISSVQLILIAALIPSAILHEISHGAAALAFGDDTAKRAGRLTLNPIPHIDPFGTVILPAILVLSGVGWFAYAKPVPVNVSRLRHPRNQAVLVSLAGPATNIVLALLSALAVKDFVPLAVRQFALESPQASLDLLPAWAHFVFLLGFANVLLAAFNLIPLPPLDGSAVLERLLPRHALPAYYRLRPFTIFLPLAVILFFPTALDHVFDPALDWFARLVV